MGGGKDQNRRKKEKELEKDNIVVIEVGMVMGGGERVYREISGNGKNIKCISR